MKRIIILLISALLLFGCTAASENRYLSSVFSVDLPETFERVPNVDIICFAPYGDPMLSSSITFYTTELNWYFDRFTEQEYETALRELCGYETLSLLEMHACRIDGYDARRISCKVTIDQGEHDLILYAINADQTCFFTLLNRDTDDYITAFDDMMKTVDLKGTH